MSEENVELARAAMEAYNRRDRDAWLALNDSEVEFRADPGWPESGTVAGREAVWDFIVSLADAWEQEDFEMVEVIDAGSDKLAVRYRRRPAKSRTNSITGAYTRSVAGRFSVTRGLRPVRKPSKPPGCRSRPADGVLTLP